MRLYRLGTLGNLDALKPVEAPDPQPGNGQVVVRIRACSLNHRDLNIVSGGYTSHALKPAAIPVSDGAGEVVSVTGDAVSVFGYTRPDPAFPVRPCSGRSTRRGVLP